MASAEGGDGALVACSADARRSPVARSNMAPAFTPGRTPRVTFALATVFRASSKLHAQRSSS